MLFSENYSCLVTYMDLNVPCSFSSTKSLFLSCYYLFVAGENIAGLLKFLIEGNEALELCLSY